MTYRELKEQRQAAFNALPIFYAFGQRQFREAMEARGLTEADTDQVYAIGGGGYYLKKDADVIADFMLKQAESDDQFRELMNDEAFAEGAFYEEMANHEYHINWQGAWDVTNCFGTCEYVEGGNGVYYLKKMGYGPATLRAWQRAHARFLNDAQENDWY